MAKTCCILNGGDGAWAFEGLANQLATALDIDVSTTPRDLNYLLFAETTDLPPDDRLFIPFSVMQLASDKRLLANCFAQNQVPTPETLLIDRWDDVVGHANQRSDVQWCLKYPTGCGASGHRVIEPGTKLPRDWPTPFVVQEFIRLEAPEVYRTYCAGGELFGWVTRRYPLGVKPSPWVAHARGARYVNVGTAPLPAQEAALAALQATGLLVSFGCVDLIQRPDGEWLVLEVGTDGMFNHVDRDLNDAGMEEEISQRIGQAFWKWAQSKDRSRALRE